MTVLVLKRWVRIGSAFTAMIFFGSSVSAGEVTVAVAANFLNPFKQLVPVFEKQSGHSVRTVSGSTGKLYAQILHGAPFEVFLAADSERPRLLESGDRAVPATRFTYALGKIVLWSADPRRITADGESILRRRNFKHLALANPKTAPYGKAAYTTLTRLNLWQSIAPVLVQGENINQTFQFIATGNAEVGFVALSQVLDPLMKIKGSQWIVPEHLYDAIDQDAVLLIRGQSQPAAKALLQFLKSDPAREIIQSYGYGLK
ncbi:MAG: molybdate ABC transporter substrate-binding protein [Nitrospinota bacterium]|nr:molybdate ABC transporter substrate-binding protein [Nitrospinota bacterium]